VNGPIQGRLQRRAIILVVAILLCLLGSGAVVVVQQQLARDAEGRAERFHQAQMDANALLVGMVDQETAIRGYGLTGDRVFLAPYAPGRQEAAAAADRLVRAHLVGAGGLAATVAAGASWQRWAAGRKATVDRAGRDINPTASLEGKRLFDAFRAAHGRLDSAVDHQVVPALADASHRSDVAGVAALVGAVGGMAALLLLGSLLLRSTLSPVRRLAAAAEAIAAGEPVTIAPTTCRDEVGALSRALVHLQDVGIERERFFTAALDAHLIVDSAGRLMDVSPAVERTTGFTKAELLTRTFGELMHPDDRKGALAALAELAQGAHETAFEASVTCRDRPSRRLSWNAASSPGSGTVYTVGRDVSEERLARDALQQQAQLLDLARDAILVRGINLEGRITYWNRGAEDTYGWTAAEAMGQSSQELLGTESPRPLREIEGQVLRTGRWEGELLHRLRDGRVIVVDSRWALRTDAAGAPDGFLEVNRDITERKRLEQALRTGHDDMVRASEAKSAFLSRMSHELRTPLNAILGFSQLLATDLGGQQADFLERIQRAGRHLLHLVNDVLDLTRVESGTVHVSIEPVSIDLVLEETVELIGPLAAARRVVVTTEPSRMGGQHVLADLQRLKQVLLNLLSNAVKYNHEGGTVAIASEPAGGWIRLTVGDTGPGIPSHKMNRLFEPFDRLDTESSGVEGTGLGLALSRHLVIAMGGAMEVESSDRGTTFTVRLPAVAAPMMQVATQVTSAIGDGPPGGGERTVLYVEDNLSNLQLIGHIVGQRRRGITLLPAMQGRLALELARTHRPDAILIDVHLPDIHGYELLRRLRAGKQTAPIPVVVISADATAGQIERFHEAGATAYLTKPLQVEEFLTVLDMALDRARDGKSV
jgi:PAS domain S-box-containing protein